MSLITSIIGGIQTRNAAHDAAGAINDAANKAGAGATSAADLGNSQIQNATTAGINNVNAAAGSAGRNVLGAAGSASSNMNTATAGAVDALNPYAGVGQVAAGQLTSGLQQGGEFNKMPSLSDLQMDPGYQFRLQQGQQAMERSAAAHGALQGGGFAKDLTNYAQGAASQEYQNAFSRFEQNMNDRYAHQMGGAALGYQAANRQGQYGTGSAEYTGNMGYGANVYAGNAGLQGSEFGAGLGFQGAKDQALFRNQAAQYSGDMTLKGGEATAAGDIGAAGAFNHMLDGIAGGYKNAAANYAANDGFDWTKLAGVI